MLISLSLLALFLAAAAQRASPGGDCQTPDEQTGVCLITSACKTMQDYLNNLPRPVPTETKQKLKSYLCGRLSNGRAKICCPFEPVSLDKPDQSKATESSANGDHPDVSNHNNLNLIPKDCGHLINDKIVNGNLTSLFEFPWMALLSYREGSTVDFQCGGTIINERYILTAAHCVTHLDQLRLVGVRVGEHNIKTKKDCEVDGDEDEVCAPPVQDLSIEQVTPHENYNTVTHVNDIALVRVSPIDLTRQNSQPVCLPVGAARHYEYGDRNVVVTGWGATEKGSKSAVLLKAELPHVPLRECRQAYKKLAKLGPSQLCAGGKTISDSCAGDSGGPLHALAFLHNQPRFIQRGIVSFGPKECGKVPYPGVYTRVASYMDWILDNMKP